MDLQYRYLFTFLFKWRQIRKNNIPDFVHWLSLHSLTLYSSDINLHIQFTSKMRVNIYAAAWKSLVSQVRWRVCVGRNALEVSHLQFADDTIFFHIGTALN